MNHNKESGYTIHPLWCIIYVTDIRYMMDVIKLKGNPLNIPCKDVHEKSEDIKAVNRCHK